MSPETAAMLLFPPCSAVCGFLKELYSLEKKQIHFFQTKHFIQLGGINGRYIVAGMCAFLLVLGVLKFIGFTCLLWKEELWDYFNECFKSPDLFFHTLFQSKGTRRLEKWQLGTDCHRPEEEPLA